MNDIDKVLWDLVTVVIPTHNRRRRLERALKSVFNQTYGSIEVIVVDDASSDDTPLFLDQMAKEESQLRYIRNEISKGGAGARNVGIENAKGTFVAFLDDDDVWLPQKLEVQIAALQTIPEAVAATCNYFVQYQDRPAITKVLSAPENLQSILFANHLGGASVCLASRTALSKIGGFDARLRSGQDWDLWIKLYQIGNIVVCDEPLVEYLPHADARITSNPLATYQGRRLLYLTYVSAMETETRKNHMQELLYCRKVSLKSGFPGKLVGLFDIVLLMGLRKSIRYIHRFFRFSLAELLHRQFRDS